MYGLSRTLNTILNIQNALERAMDGRVDHSSTYQSGVFPPVNILEKDEVLHVICELPGVRSEDLDLEIKGRHLRIHGERKNNIDEHASIHRLERSNGAFDRTFGLPYEVDSNQAKASFTDGLLTIELPKAEAEKAKRISIN